MSGLTWIERLIHPERLGTLRLLASDDGPTEEQMRALLRAAGLSVRSFSVNHEPPRGRRVLEFDRGRPRDQDAPPRLVGELANHQGVLSVRWRRSER